MAFPISNGGPIGRAQYWRLFGMSMLPVAGLATSALGALASGELSLALYLLIPVAPMGVFFKVVESRRCWDIGWPGQLPWLFLGAFGLAGYGQFTGIWTTSDPLPDLRLLMLVSVADLAFAITIGCIRGKPANAGDGETFDPAMGEDDEAESEEDRNARWDAAIRKALGTRAGPRGGAPSPATPLRRAIFGRRRNAA